MLGAVIQGSAGNLKGFLVGRALAGLGEGVYLSTMGVYICEVVPLKHRGILAGLPQFLATAGVCAGYFTCYATVHLGTSMAWRVPFVVMAALGVCFVGGSCVVSESPRWLLMKGRREEAVRAFERLGFVMHEEQQAILGGMGEQRGSLGAWQGFLLLWKRGYRARTILALFILGMVQLSGIDGVLYVSIPLSIRRSSRL